MGILTLFLAVGCSSEEKKTKVIKIEAKPSKFDQPLKPECKAYHDTANMIIFRTGLQLDKIPDSIINAGFQYLDLAITCDSAQFMSWVNKGSLLMDLERNEEALVHLLKMKKYFNEDNFVIYDLLGGVYVELEQKDSALVYFRKALVQANLEFQKSRNEVDLANYILLTNKVEGEQQAKILLKKYKKLLKEAPYEDLVFAIEEEGFNR